MPQMKPLFIIKPGSMSPQDIKRAERFAGLVIVECADPSAVRLLEPPLDKDVPAQAQAALQLMRKVTKWTTSGDCNFSRHWLMQGFLDTLIMDEPPPPPLPVQSVKSGKK